MKWISSTTTLGWCLLPLLATSPLSARPQESATDPRPLPVQLERLNTSLERIVQLLERHAGGQRLELLMKRVELGTTRMAQAEEQLQRVRATKASIENEKLELEARLAQLAEALDAGTVSMSIAAIEHYTGELDLKRRLLERRLQGVDGEIIDLEIQVRERRIEVQSWQDEIDRELRSP